VRVEARVASWVVRWEIVVESMVGEVYSEWMRCLELEGVIFEGERRDSLPFIASDRLPTSRYIYLTSHRHGEIPRFVV
jgi:hypothetical protein